jgi:hypothetical protein
MKFVKDHSAAVLDFCKHTRTMKEIRQHFHQWPDQARFTVHNLVKKGHLINMVPGAKRGLYLTKSKPPVLRVKPKPKPVKAVPARKSVANSVWQLGAL